MDDTKGGGTEEFAAKEEHLDTSQVSSCVIHQILTGNKKELKTNQEWLRTNIFHTQLMYIPSSATSCCSR
jgi:hypothetical protein